MTLYGAILAEVAPLPKGQALVLRSIYEFRFLRRSCPYPPRQDAELQCARVVPLCLIDLELTGTGVDLRSAVDALSVKGLVCWRKTGDYVPSGNWTFADGRSLQVTTRDLRVGPGTHRIERNASIDGVPVPLRYLDHAGLDLTSDGASMAEAMLGLAEVGTRSGGAETPPAIGPVVNSSAADGKSSTRLYGISDAWRRLRDAGLTSLNYDAFRRWPRDSRRHQPRAQLRREVMAAYLEEARMFNADAIDELANRLGARTHRGAKQSRTSMTK